MIKLGEKLLRKKYSELTFTDDYMFWKILVTNIDLCKELLELILGVKIRKICPPEGQKTIEHRFEGKGIRLDVYVEDDENTVYDLEMQTTLKKDLPKRIRYYQGIIDSNLISRNEPYSKLKKSNIIFICTDDPFGKGLPIYKFENICVQDTSLKLGDDAVKIVVNPNSCREDLSEEMNGIMDLLQGKSVAGGLAGKIANAVFEAKRYEEWEAEYMTLDMKLMEEREEGREEGRTMMLVELVNSNKITVEEAVTILGISEEAFQRIMAGDGIYHLLDKTTT